MCVRTQTACGQSRLQPMSEAWGRCGGRPAAADRLLEIIQLKIDRYSERFKDHNAGFYERMFEDCRPQQHLRHT